MSSKRPSSAARSKPGGSSTSVLKKGPIPRPSSAPRNAARDRYLTREDATATSEALWREYPTQSPLVEYQTSEEYQHFIHTKAIVQYYRSSTYLPTYYFPAPHVFQQQQQQHEMELLSLYHEIRDKNSYIMLLYTKYDKIEQNFNYLLYNHKSVLAHLEELKTQNEEERMKNIKLTHELYTAKLEAIKIKEHKTKIESLKEEIAYLKKINQSLQYAILDEGKAYEFRERDKYEKRIKQLEQEIEDWTHYSTKQFQVNEEIQRRIDELYRKISQLELDKAGLNETIRQKDLEIAETLKEASESKSRARTDANTIDEKNKAIRRLEYTIQELQSTIERLQRKHERMSSDLQHYMSLKTTRTIQEPLYFPPTIYPFESKQILTVNQVLLDDTTTTMKLSKAMQTTPVKQPSPPPVVQPLPKPASPPKAKLPETLLEAIRLEGLDSIVFDQAENTFEIEIDSVMFSSNFSMQFSAEYQIGFFFNFEFFEHEMVCTPVVRCVPARASTAVGFSAVYRLSMDKLFLFYLVNHNLDLTMQLSKGNADHEPVATSEVPLKELLNLKNADKEHRGFFALKSRANGYDIGTVSVVLRFYIPLQYCAHVQPVQVRSLQADSPADHSLDAELAAAFHT